MAAVGHPGAGKVVGHEVYEVDVLVGLEEVYFAEGPCAGGQGGGEEVPGTWKLLTEAEEESGVSFALFKGFGVFPVY